MQTESTEFLYTPPPGAHDHEEELLAWHKRTASVLIGEPHGRMTKKKEGAAK